MLKVLDGLLDAPAAAIGEGHLLRAVDLHAGGRDPRGAPTGCGTPTSPLE